jgi:uncharacterized protein (TIGR00251 family)
MGPISCLSATLDGSVVMDVEVTPASKVQGITGFNTWRNRLSIAVAAEAKQGQANQALLHVLSAQLVVEKQAISIASGHRSRLKSVRIEGVSVEHLSKRIAEFLEVEP